MHRNTNRARLVGNSTGNCLTNPPGCIGTKLKAFIIVKLFNSLNQTQVALLNQIQEKHATAHIALSDAHY